MAIYPFTVLLRMPVNEMEELVARAQEEAADPAYKAYVSLYALPPSIVSSC
jgi:hypothetical protein